MSNRKSELGKLYDTVQQEVDENGWVKELVDSILDEVQYMIEVEQYKLPLPCLSTKNTVRLISKRDIDRVLKALEAKGVIAEFVTLVSYGYFKVTELLWTIYKL